jgi:hypothetical protein
MSPACVAIVCKSANDIRIPIFLNVFSNKENERPCRTSSEFTNNFSDLFTSVLLSYLAPAHHNATVDIIASTPYVCKSSTHTATSVPKHPSLIG